MTKIDVQKTENKKKITIHKMVVPKEERGKGIGTKHLKEILSEADKNGKRVELSPSADFGGNVSKLKKWYKSHGFVENKGKNKDYEISHSYYRNPKK